MAVNKQSVKRIQKQKNTLKRGDIKPFVSFLEQQAVADDLAIIREQKLLLVVRDPDLQDSVATAYKLAASRTMTSELRPQAEMYSDFVLLASASFRQLEAKCQPLFQEFRFVGLLDLLEMCESVLTDFATSLSARYQEEYEPALSDPLLKAGERSDACEAFLQALSGQLKDLVFASARVLNEAVRRSDRLERRVKDRAALNAARESFEQLTLLATNWNSIDYALDKVSFGEWFVSSIESGNPPKVYFDEIDVRLAKARSIGLRRRLVWFQQLPKVPRFSRDTLRSAVTAFVDAAFETYEHQVGVVCESTEEYRAIRQRLDKQLETLDADDDLLIAVGPEVLVHYYAAIALRCFRDVGKCVLSMLPTKRRRAVRRLPVPLNEIHISVPGNPQFVELFVGALEKQIVTLPVRNPLDLVSKPFFRLPNGQVFATDCFDTTSWSDEVRQTFVHGGRQTDLFGRIWEDFIADSLGDYGWTIFGKGIKLKRDGSTLTDVDIIAGRDDLLLVLQVKAFARAGVNTYEQWLSRNQIIKGGTQALIAVSELTENPQLLCSLQQDKGVATPPRIIQPVVVTNSCIFSGWSTQGVPVIGLGELMSILRGAKVIYQTEQEYVETHTYCEADSPTSDEFLRLLNEPLSWCIASETDETEHFHAATGTLDFYFPQLRRTQMPLKNQLYEFSSQ